MHTFFKKYFVHFLGALFALSSFQLAAALEDQEPLEVRVHITDVSKDPIIFMLPQRLGYRGKYLKASFRLWEKKYKIPFFHEDQKYIDSFFENFGKFYQLGIDYDWLYCKTKYGDTNFEDWFKTKKKDKVLNLYYIRGNNAKRLTVNSYGGQAVFKNKNGGRPLAAIEADFPWENAPNSKKIAKKDHNKLNKNLNSYQEEMKIHRGAYDYETKDDYEESDDEESSSLEFKKEESWASIEENIEREMPQNMNSFYKEYALKLSKAPLKPDLEESKEDDSVYEANENSDEAENAKERFLLDFVPIHVALRQVIHSLTDEMKKKIEKGELPPPYIVQSVKWEDRTPTLNYDKEPIKGIGIPLMKGLDAFTIAFTPMISFIDMASQSQKNYLLKNTKASTWKAYMETFPSDYKVYQKAYQKGEWIPLLSRTGTNRQRQEKLENILEFRSKQLKICLGYPQVIVHFGTSIINMGALEQWRVFQSKTTQKEITTQKELLNGLLKEHGASLAGYHPSRFIYDPFLLHLFKDQERCIALPSGNLNYHKITQSSVCYAEYGFQIKLHFSKEDKDPLVIYLPQGLYHPKANFCEALKYWKEAHYADPLLCDITDYMIKEKDGSFTSIDIDWEFPKGVNTLDLYHKGIEQVKKINIQTVDKLPYFKKTSFSKETTFKIEVNVPFKSESAQKDIERSMLYAQIGKHFSSKVLKQIKKKDLRSPYMLFSSYASMLPPPKKIYPLKNKSEPILVAFQPVLTLIHGVTLTKRHLFLNGYFSPKWQDYLKKLPPQYQKKNLYLLYEVSNQKGALEKADEDDNKEEEPMPQEVRKSQLQKTLVEGGLEKFAQTHLLQPFLHEKMELRLLHFSTLSIDFYKAFDGKLKWRSTHDLGSINRGQIKAKINFPKKEWIHLYSDKKGTQPIPENLILAKDTTIYAFYGIPCPIFTDYEEKNSIKWLFSKEPINENDAPPSLSSQLQAWCQKNKNPVIDFDDLFIRKKIGKDFAYLHFKSADPKLINSENDLAFCFKKAQRVLPKNKSYTLKKTNEAVRIYYRTKKMPTLTVNFQGPQVALRQLQIKAEPIFTRGMLGKQLRKILNNKKYNVDDYFYFPNLERLVGEGKLLQQDQKYILKEDITLEVNYTLTLGIYDPFRDRNKAKKETILVPDNIQTQQEINKYLIGKYKNDRLYYQPKATKAIYLPITKMLPNKVLYKNYYKNQPSFFTLKKGQKEMTINLGELQSDQLEGQLPLIWDFLSRQSKENYWKKKRDEGAMLYFKDDQGQLITDLSKYTLSSLPQPCLCEVGFKINVGKMEDLEKKSVVKIVEKPFLDKKTLQEIIPLQEDCYYAFNYTLKGKNDLKPLSLDRPLETKKLKNGTLRYRTIPKNDPQPPWEKEENPSPFYNHKLESLSFKTITIVAPDYNDSVRRTQIKNFTFTCSYLKKLFIEAFEIGDDDEEFIHLYDLGELVKQDKLLKEKEKENYILKEDISLEGFRGNPGKMYDTFAMNQKPQAKPYFFASNVNTQQKINEKFARDLRYIGLNDKIRYYKPQEKSDIFLPLTVMENPDPDKITYTDYYTNQPSFFSLQKGKQTLKANLGKLKKDELKGIDLVIINYLSQHGNKKKYWQKKQADGAKLYFKDENGKVILDVEGKKVSTLPQPCNYDLGFKITVKKINAPEEESVVKIIEQERLNREALQNLIPLKENLFYAFSYSLKDDATQKLKAVRLDKGLPEAKNLEGATLYYREIKAVDNHPDWEKKNIPTIYNHALKEIKFKEITINQQENNYKVIYKEKIKGQSLYDAIPKNAINPKIEGLYYKHSFEEYTLLDPEKILPNDLPGKLESYAHTDERLKEPDQKGVTIHIPIGYSFLEKMIYWMSWGWFDVSKNKDEKKFSFSFPEFVIEKGEIKYEHFLKALAQKEEIPKAMRKNLRAVEVIIKEEGEEEVHAFTPITLKNKNNLKMESYIQRCNRKEDHKQRVKTTFARLSRIKNSNAEVYVLPPKELKEETFEKNVVISFSMWSLFLFVSFLGLVYKYKRPKSLKAHLASKLKERKKRKKYSPIRSVRKKKPIKKKKIIQKAIESEKALEEKTNASKNKEGKKKKLPSIFFWTPI